MKIDIETVISKYTKLTKLGPGYTGTCPLCGAKGKSDFTVSVKYQKFDCRKCGVSGGIFQFLMSHNRIVIEEALNEVKETFNISFNADYLDARWNDYLKGTDFQMILNQYAKKSSSIFEENDLIEVKRPTKKKPISYTLLATFIRCPLEYKLRYHDKVKEYQPSGRPVKIGRFLHSLASRFLRQPLKNKNQHYIHSQFNAEIRSSASSGYIEELKLFEEPTSALLLSHFADKQLANGGAHFKTAFGSHVLTGTADCLIKSPDGIELIEFKEYDYREFQEDSDILHYLQLLFYYFGLREKHLDIKQGTYCFFSSGLIDSVNFSAKMVDRTRTFLENKLEEITNCKVFIPKPNRLCSTCGYKDKCEKYRTKLREGLEV